MIDALYDPDFSTKMLAFWRSAGGPVAMRYQFQSMLLQLSQRADSAEISERTEQMARLLAQNGVYDQSLEFAQSALEIEEVGTRWCLFTKV